MNGLRLADVADQVEGVLGGREELIWVAGSLLALILLALLVFLVVRMIRNGDGDRGASADRSSSTDLSREELVDRAARAETERDYLRQEVERLRNEIDRSRSAEGGERVSDDGREDRREGGASRAEPTETERL